MLKKILLLSLISSCALAETRVYFSPNGDCEKNAINLVNRTTKQLDIAMYSFNNDHLIEAIKTAKSRGVSVRILLDRSQAYKNDDETLDLFDSKFDVKIHSLNRIQHNKFVVSDQKEVMTGSFNWTDAAQDFNEENCLFLDDQKIVNIYQKQFDNHLWKVNTQDKSQNTIRKIREKLGGNNGDALQNN